jgi:RNA polymerase sigma-70 factor (ECF subfamily)
VALGDLASAYHSYRPLLFSIAYRMTGSAVEAEDILQDGYLRVHAAAAAASGEAIGAPRAYLSTLITRLSLDHQKRVKAERERYDGPWLPEPVLTSLTGATTVQDTADPADVAERRESISLAVLVLLESLSPEERATFLLHEVFDFPHDAIAPMIGKSPAACRQLLRRARARLAARRRSRQRPSPADHQRLVARFLRAVERGDVQALAETLAQDVVHVSDGGGETVAARRPVVGRDAVLRLLAGLLRLAPPGTRYSSAEVNGAPALLVWVGERLVNVTTFEVEDGVVTRSYAVVNPHKLTYLHEQLRRAEAAPV